MKISDYIDISEKEVLTFSGAVLKSESEKLTVAPQEIIERTTKILSRMKESLIPPESVPIRCSMAGTAAEQYKNSPNFGTLLSPLMADASAMALQIAQNSAGMGVIVAAPTAGACGVLPGVLMSLEKHRNISEQQLVDGLINASGVGMVIADVVGVAGASGGCQAEIGTASAMAASAVTEIMGGNSEQCGNAIALALKFVMGLVCDPVAGLVVCPCIKRNGSAAVNAIFAAELALSNVKSMIPPDEVISAMKQVGDSMNITLKETALGGLAITPTGLKIAEELAELSDKR